MDKLRNTRSTLRLIIAVASPFLLFNNVTIVAYSQDFGSQAKAAAVAKAKEEAAAQAKAEAAARRHKPAPVSSSINPKQYGAVGDGVHDDQDAINAAIAEARATKKAVKFSSGNYRHSSVIVVNGVALLGAGSDTILTASNGANGAVQLTGNNASFSGFTISNAHMVAQNGGWPVDATPQGSAVWVDSAKNFTVSRVIIPGAGGNGIDVGSSGPGTLSNNQISNVSKSGIDMWDCSDVQVLNNNEQNAGSVPLMVGAKSTGSTNLTIANNVFQTGTNSGALPALMLGSLQSSSFSNNECNGYGLNVANFFLNSPAVTGLLISNNTFNGPTGYGMLVGYNVGSGSPVSSTSNITISHNKINNVQRSTLITPTAIIIQTAQNVDVSSNSINTSAGVGISIAASQNIAIDANTISNTVGGAIMAWDSGTINRSTGSLTISNNQLANICINSGSVISVSNTQDSPAPSYLYTSLSIVGNTLSGSANGAQYYIYCSVPSNDGVTGFTRTISGDNPGTTLLPNYIAP